MNTAELEYRLLYSVVVAGKSAKFANAAMGVSNLYFDRTFEPSLIPTL